MLGFLYLFLAWGGPDALSIHSSTGTASLWWWTFQVQNVTRKKVISHVTVWTYIMHVFIYSYVLIFRIHILSQSMWKPMWQSLQSQLSTHPWHVFMSNELHKMIIFSTVNVYYFLVYSLSFFKNAGSDPMKLSLQPTNETVLGAVPRE